MGELYGLHCSNSRCVHDTVTAYRLRFMVRPDVNCMICHKAGTAMTIPEAAAMQGLDLEEGTQQSLDSCGDWWRCSLSSPCDKPWRRRLQTERNDMIFRAHQLDSALGQMQLLGVSNPTVGHHIVENNHHSLPPGFDQRLLILRQEPMPRMALYMRWRPETGELLRPDMCLQGLFPPNSTAEQRRNAHVRHLIHDEFEELFRSMRRASQNGRMIVEQVSTTKIRCQHCTQLLPLKVFNTQCLHEAQWGD